LLECDYECINEEYNNLNEITLTKISDVLSVIMGNDVANINIDELFATITDINNNITDLKNSFDLIYDFMLNKDDTAQVSVIINSLNQVKNINDCKKWFKDKSYLLGEYLGGNYIGEKRILII